MEKKWLETEICELKIVASMQADLIYSDISFAQEIGTLLQRIGAWWEKVRVICDWRE